MFVEQKVYDEFVGRVAEFGKKLQVGNGLDPNTQIGPLVSKDQLERVSGYLDIGQKEGAKALAGGSRLTEGALSKGYLCRRPCSPMSRTICGSRRRRFSAP